MWKSFFTIRIMGDPVATGRVRFSKQGGAYKPTKTRNAMARRIVLIQKSMRENNVSKTDLAVRVELNFYHKRPQRLKTKKYNQKELIFKTTKPDVDNLIKLMLDSGTNAGLWEDDNQICQIEVKDWYSCDPDPDPRTIMNVCLWEPDNENISYT